MICLGDEIFCCYWRGEILLATFFLVKVFRWLISNFFQQKSFYEIGIQLLLICLEDEIFFITGEGELYATVIICQ